jgi:hypothetical protein
MHKPTNDRPIRFMAEGEDGQAYVVTVYPKFITIRPKGARKADSTVEVTVPAMYRRGLLTRVDAERAKSPRRKVKRGLLNL